MRIRKSKPYWPLLLLFIVLNALFLAFRSLWQRMGANQDVLIMGNVFLCLITLLSFFISLRGIRNPNTQGFIRGVYGGIMLKLFACIILAVAYIASVGKAVNKPALFICMGLYLVYTFVEVSILTKLLKAKPNAQEGSPS